MSHLYRIDAEELKKVHISASSRHTKREYILKGYTLALSLYGAFTNKDTNKTRGIRIEILSNIPYTESLTLQILSFFEHIHPTSKYTIWIYDKDEEALKCVGRYK